MAVTLASLRLRCGSSFQLDTSAGLWLKLGRYSAHVTREDRSAPAFVETRDRSLYARLGQLYMVASAE